MTLIHYFVCLVLFTTTTSAAAVGITTTAGAGDRATDHLRNGRPLYLLLLLLLPQ